MSQLVSQKVLSSKDCPESVTLDASCVMMTNDCRTLTLAMAAGIGFFLAHIGYQAGEGIGLVVADPATLVTLGQILKPSLKSMCPWLCTASAVIGLACI